MRDTHTTLHIRPELVVTKGPNMKVICSKCPPEPMLVTQPLDLNKLRIKMRSTQPLIKPKPRPIQQVPFTELRINLPQPVIGVKKKVRGGSREEKRIRKYEVVGNSILL
jgi:hypothetical protein